MSAAYFYRKAAGNDARILILDVLDDFGGHAKRNEFDVNGRKLLGYGGTYAIESPSPYSPIAKSVIDDLGIDVTSDARVRDTQALSVARHGPRRVLRQRNLRRRPAAARSQTGEGRRFRRSRHHGNALEGLPRAGALAGRGEAGHPADLRGQEGLHAGLVAGREESSPGADDLREVSDRDRWAATLRW